jgi:nucleotide-binding universal stress UspA family protein
MRREQAMFKNILIAVDGSAYTESVINHAIALANFFSSQIFVLTVVDVRVFEWASSVGADGFVTIVPSGIYQDESLNILDEKCEKILQKCKALLEKENLKFKLEKTVGSPVESIMEKAQIADLVIMGKRGEFERWDKNEMGATVQAIGRNIAKPLFVVKKECRPLKKIMLGYDSSQHANRALQITANLAEKVGAQLSVISVTDDPEYGKCSCKEAAEYLSSYGVSVETVVLTGDPDKELVHYAQQSNADLIVIGAFGHSRIHEAILGSTTEHILRFSTIPVLLAK